MCIRDSLYLIQLIPLLPEKPQAGIRHIGVVKNSTLLRNLIKGRVYTLGRSVWAVGTHGLDDVGHSQDARLQTYFLPLEAQGVARSIDPLVVLVSNPGHRPREI